MKKRAPVATTKIVHNKTDTLMPWLRNNNHLWKSNEK